MYYASAVNLRSNCTYRITRSYFRKVKNQRVSIYFGEFFLSSLSNTMKIKILVPDKNNVKWRISFGNKANRRLTSLGTINLLASRLPAILKEGKASVYVDYGQLDNETLASDDIKYLVYTTVLFLEDYLSQKTWNRLTRQWCHRTS